MGPNKEEGKKDKKKPAEGRKCSSSPMYHINTKLCLYIDILKWGTEIHREWLTFCIELFLTDTENYSFSDYFYNTSTSINIYSVMLYSLSKYATFKSCARVKYSLLLRLGTIICITWCCATVFPSLHNALWNPAFICTDDGMLRRRKRFQRWKQVWPSHRIWLLRALTGAEAALELGDASHVAYTVQLGCVAYRWLLLVVNWMRLRCWVLETFGKRAFSVAIPRDEGMYLSSLGSCCAVVAYQPHRHPRLIHTIILVHLQLLLHREAETNLLPVSARDDVIVISGVEVLVRPARCPVFESLELPVWLAVI